MVSVQLAPPISSSHGPPAYRNWLAAYPISIAWIPRTAICRGAMSRPRPSRPAQRFNRRALTVSSHGTTIRLAQIGTPFALGSTAVSATCAGSNSAMETRIR